MAKNSKSKYWTAVLYIENMRDDWQDEIADIVQVPFCYCIHDKDRNTDGTLKKAHVHAVLAFSNTTTRNRAIDVLEGLEKPGQEAFHTIEAVYSIRHCWDYLIHATETAVKQKKYQYSPEERIAGNGFDIGAMEQLSATAKNSMAKELCDIILNEGFTNFADFYAWVVENKPAEYFEVIKSNNGLFERLTKGCWQRMVASEKFWKQ